MPRKAFVADLRSAVEGVSIAGISNVQNGDDDGEFTFYCKAGGEQLQLSALVTDVSEYPSSHTYMMFAAGDVPARVADVVSDISDSATGKSIIQLLELVSRKLEMVDRDGDHHMAGSQYSDGNFDDEDYEDDEADEVDEGEEYFPDDDIVAKPVLGKLDSNPSTNGYTKSTLEFRQRIRADLLIAKASGFKVGHLGGLMDGIGCYLSLSCRISKLGISTEAMQAWQVEPSEYLVVIFHYPSGYQTMDQLKSYDATTARRNFGMRVGISTTYKPTMQEAVQAFTTLSKDMEKRHEESSQAESNSQITARKGFRASFISRPLNELLEERFPTLLVYRYNGMPWNGAEQFYNDHYGAQAHSEGYQDKYIIPEKVSAAYPPIVTADHIQEAINPVHSLPVVGMQFVLRHFVRCTEFCLICFTKMPDDLQAIKPYVCDKPLCLYQYMSLGFGPSIEHEVLSQPKVVDLLVSFCYTAARMGGLKDFPAGLSLMVPPSDLSKHSYIGTAVQNTAMWHSMPPQPAQAPPEVAKETTPLQKMRFNEVAREILFDNQKEKCPLRTGDWIAITRGEFEEVPIHCRIMDTTLYPTVRLGEPVIPAVNNEQLSNDRYQYAAPPKSATGPPKPKKPPVDEFVPASFYVYDQNFDDLGDEQKRQAIFSLLDILPPVEEMRKYLLRHSQSPLSTWVDRLPPAVLGLLRWIIASNRACIMQVEEEAEGGQGQERLYGMAGWTQFRFAMGAPDKERRFMRAVRETTDRLKLNYSTIFAWHGSPLWNWHSIIREGLHFKHTTHGRAYGHGVYHSQDLNTSMGYSGMAGNYWQASDLKITQAMALNEIVNAPKEFVSSSPHLVVAQLDWIQTRYLFVKTQSSSPDGYQTKSEAKPKQFIEQDPNKTPKGMSGEHIIIPVSAISSFRRGAPQRHVTQKSPKRQRTASGATASDPIELDCDDDDDNCSVTTLDEDRMIFEEEDSAVSQPGPLIEPSSSKGKSKAGGFLSKLVHSKSAPKPLTDFVPGTLDFSTLPVLQQPTWATPAATKRLMRDFQDLIKLQDKEPAHELGWYVDPKNMDNIYQWIVELHSFDPTLPLAKDMKAKGHKSIVLELRFGNQYPMSPPFVRVIRPRFLGFQQGGGGHVTAGGAMCMQLLTNDGWSAVSSIESVLLQVRMAMCSLDPKPARLENGSRSDYGVGEAIQAYIRACQMHGWTVPAGFREMALGGAQNAQDEYV